MIDLSSKKCRCWQIEGSDLVLLMQKLKEQEKAIQSYRDSLEHSEDDSSYTIWPY